MTREEGHAFRIQIAIIIMKHLRKILQMGSTVTANVYAKVSSFYWD
jgi:hypothetical protein